MHEDPPPAVLTEIRELLDLPAGAELPPRASLEHTLTSGYAYALGLERELADVRALLSELREQTF